MDTKQRFLHLLFLCLLIDVCQIQSNVLKPVVPSAPVAFQPSFPNVVVGPALVPLKPQPQLFPIDAACLKCMCWASTQCAPRACHSAGPTQYYCGSYLISWAYWADAGKPQDNPHNPHEFERCLTNNTCAEQTIRQYMTKYGQDCNADGRVNCLDYARIHKSGPHDCAATWVDNTDYWKALTACVQQAQLQ